MKARTQGEFEQTFLPANKIRFLQSEMLLNGLYCVRGNVLDVDRNDVQAAIQVNLDCRPVPAGQGPTGNVCPGSAPL